MNNKNNSKGNRKILVTGAAGFLGGTICRQLVERGEDVRAFVLPNDPAMKYVPDEAEVIEGDLTDKASLEKFFTVPEGAKTVVLHIASIVSVNPVYNQKVMDVNVGGTQNIIDLCLAYPECQKQSSRIRFYYICFGTIVIVFGYSYYYKCGIQLYMSLLSGNLTKGHYEKNTISVRTNLSRL